MDIGSMLKYYEYTEKVFSFNEKEWKYFLAIREYNKTLFSKNYIFDLEEHNDLLDLFLEKDNFEKFQKELLEAVFFHAEGDSRYNIYLIFLVPRNTIVAQYSYIQNDFRFARKVILEEKEAEYFFSKAFYLKREMEKDYFEKIKIQKDIVDEILNMGSYIEDLVHKQINIFYLLNHKRKGIPDFGKIIPIIQNISRYEECASKFSFGEESGKNNINYDEDYIIKNISGIHIENYRGITTKKLFPFRKVNLIYGGNGMGKSTILDAIELALTGKNKKQRDRKKNKNDTTFIKIECINRNGKKISLCQPTKDYRNLAATWYGMDKADKNSFNRYFNQINYFDTNWASSFAIEGEERVNLEQLKAFLAINNIQEMEEILKNMCRDIISISAVNRKKVSQISLYKKENKTLRKDIDDACKISDRYKERLEKYEAATLENIVARHIGKIEEIFKLLVSSNEYVGLKINGNEIVAIRSGSKETVPMSKMSTGQKICLILAFMFALFLSCESAPNIILLDEPVANLDDLHMLNLLDVLRRLAIADTQIFFTTANVDVAQMFRRKFSFLEDDFIFYTLEKENNIPKIHYETFCPDCNECKKSVEI